MTRNTHDSSRDHHGKLRDAQLADGTPATGDVPVSNGDGTRTWSAGGGGGGVGGTKAAAQILMGGGGYVVPVGTRADMVVPFSGTITGWTLLADVSGTLLLDLWKDTYANHPPVTGDSITGSTPPSLTSQTKNKSTALTGWNTTVTAGDVIRVVVVSIATITRATLVIEITKSGGSVGAAPTLLDDLTDVDTATVPPTTGQALVWDGSQWEPGTVASGGGATTLDALTDVDVSTVPPTTGQALVWDGTQWEPGSVAASGGGGGSMEADTFIGDGSDTTFALTGEPVDAVAVVTLNGAQVLPADYSISGTTLTMDTAPANLDELVVTYATTAPGGGGGGGDPVPGGAYDDEFTAYSGWSSYGSPAFEVANVTDFPGKLHLRWAGPAGVIGTSGIYKAMPLQPPYVLDLVLTDAIMAQLHHWWGITVFEAGSPPAKFWQAGMLFSSSGLYLMYGGWSSATTRTSNAETNWGDRILGARIIVTSHKQLTFCWSKDGKVWQHYNLVTINPGFTIANFGITVSRFSSGVNTYMELVADYLRAFQPGTPLIPIMTSATAPSGTASAGSEYGAGYNAWAAMGGGGTNASGWLTAASPLPTYIQYQFGSAQTATKYSLFPWNVDNFPGRNPKTWTLQGSNNGSSWTTIDTRTDQFPKVNELWWYTVTTPGSYTYYRLAITANWGDTYLGLGGFQLHA